MDKERNKLVSEGVYFHLIQALSLLAQLDLSGLGPLEEKEWNDRVANCRNALEFTKDLAKKLSALFE